VVKQPGHEADLFLVLRLIVGGTVPQIPHVPSWHAKDNFTLPTDQIQMSINGINCQPRYMQGILHLKTCENYSALMAWKRSVR